MSETLTTIRDLLWAAYEREGFRSIAAMAEANDVEYHALWRWMKADRDGRRPTSPKSLSAVARIVEIPLDEVLGMSLTEGAPAMRDTRVQRTTTATAQRLELVTTLLSALVRKHGSIEEAQQDLGVPEGTLLGLLNMRLELMTVKGLRTVAEDIGIPFSELVRHIDQGNAPERLLSPGEVTRRLLRAKDRDATPTDYSSRE